MVRSIRSIQPRAMLRAGIGGRIGPEPALLLTIAGLLTIQALYVVYHGHQRLFAFDFRAYWLAGRRLAAGADIYLTDATPRLGDPNLFPYPPVLALPFVPFGALPFTMAMALWTAINLAALAVGVGICAAIFARAAGRRPRHTEVLGGLAIVVASGAIFEVIGVGNIAALMFAGHAAALYAVFAGRPLVTAAILSALVLIKLYPAALLLWLAARGNPMRTGALAAAIILAAVIVLSAAWAPLRESWLTYPGFIMSLAAAGADPKFNLGLAAAAEPYLGRQLAFAAHTLLATTGLVATVLAARRSSVAAGFLVATATTLLLSTALWRHGLLFLVPPLVALYPRPEANRRLLLAAVSAMVVGSALQWPPVTVLGIVLAVALGLWPAIAPRSARRLSAA